MNLEDSDLGEDYIDGTTWQMLPGITELDIAPPTATGACDTAVFYKFTPPACIKSVRFQITTNASSEVFGFGLVDDDDVSDSKYKYRRDDIIYSLIRSFAHSFTASIMHNNSVTH